jgi:hypothetical protein
VCPRSSRVGQLRFCYLLLLCIPLTAVRLQTHETHLLNCVDQLADRSIRHRRNSSDIHLKRTRMETRFTPLPVPLVSTFFTLSSLCMKHKRSPISASGWSAAPSTESEPDSVSESDSDDSLPQQSDSARSSSGRSSSAAGSYDSPAMEALRFSAPSPQPPSIQSSPSPAQEEELFEFNVSETGWMNASLWERTLGSLSFVLCCVCRMARWHHPPMLADF